MLIAQELTAIQKSLLSRIADARQKSDELFQVVRPEAIYDRPIPERHRIIFYIGHLEAFDWNLLGERAFDLPSLNPSFDKLFAFGIDPVGGGLPNDEPEDWPTIELVDKYVQRVRSALDDKLMHPDAIIRVDDKSLETLLNVAIEHRLMHLETLAYMLHQLALDKKIKQPSTATDSSFSVNHEMINIPSGDATLGLVRGGDIFGWDNEFERQTVQVPAFAIDRYMVTNEQFLEFMDAGGYDKRTLWTESDWAWRVAKNVSHPAFWKQSNDGWLFRTMFQEIPLPLNWPAYVSHAEAAAYARWANKSLPTEAEWHRAAYGTSSGTENHFPWGTEEPNPKLGNFDFQRWDPAPVNDFPRGKSAFGVEGMLGNGWEWTSTVFAPFPGFEAFPFYRGYSADFFDGKHFVMKGGSARTAACMLRPTFRNWFQAHYQYVYAGFRCVSR